MTSRSRTRPIAALAAAVALLAAQTWTGPARAEADDAAAKPVKLAAETQRKLGLATEPLIAAHRAASLSGYVRVLDPGPLAQLDSDIQAAAAAAEASAAEAARAKALNADGQALSAKALEAAQAQAGGDAARLALLRRRVGLEWGGGLARLSAKQRDALLTEIAAGKAALIRIDTAGGVGLAGLRDMDIDLGPLGSVHAAVLGGARAADAHLMSPGLIAKAAGPNARLLSVGLAAPVTLTASAAATGVLAPRAALIRSNGKTWVYVRTSADTFQRREVADGRVEPDGLFAPAGFKPGEAVVTQGAAALFAAETNVGEAGGD
jgi:hypothetical protein